MERITLSTPIRGIIKPVNVHLFFFFFTFNFHLQSIDQWMGFSNQMSSTALLEQLESHTCAAHMCSTYTIL